MRILALDLGKQKTAAYLLDRDRDEHRHTTVKASSAALHDLIISTSPQRVVFEICPIAGWLSDLVRAMDIDLQVVNVAGGKKCQEPFLPTSAPFSATFTARRSVISIRRRRSRRCWMSCGWMCGHEHHRPYSKQEIARKGGTTFINIASMSHAYGSKASQSFVLEFAEGADKDRGPSSGA